jgi:hypothetical protein
LGRSVAALPYLHLLVESCRRRYEQGDQMAMLDALFACLSSYRGPPTWIVDAFCAAWLKWTQYEVPTLDAAFGIAPRTKKQHKRLRDWEMLRSFILVKAELLRREGTPVDIRMFESIGADIGRSGSFVSRVYYDEASTSWRKILRKIRFAENV